MEISRIVIAHSLNEIVRHSVRALIRRYHLSRDWIIGLTGLRGSGKSIGAANIVLRDFAMNDEPIWSNQDMRLNVKVDDMTARYCGMAGGGIVTYQAQPLEKAEFLNLDSRYEGGCVHIDEPNIEYGESRRSGTNTNLATDTVVQQLRHLQCGLVYSVINEMFVDLRIREATDLFIRCSDVALGADNLRAKMAQGHVFEWELYAMTARVAGNENTYANTHKPLYTHQITMRDLWGVIDTRESQRQTQKYSGAKELLPVELKEKPEAVEEKNQWAWLYLKLEQFYQKHERDGEWIEILSNEFRQEIGVTPDLWGYTVRKIRETIPGIITRGKGTAVNPTYYYIPNRILVPSGG